MNPLRHEVAPGDAEAVERLVRATGVFSEAEVQIARELVEERLARGDRSGYHFVLADEGGALAGYACWGPIPCTVHSHDLYWIAVDPGLQRQGLARRLLDVAEARIAAAGARRIYVETSTRGAYLSARSFYAKNGYAEAAVFEDFYAPNDGKVVFLKVLAG